VIGIEQPQLLPAMRGACIVALLRRLPVAHPDDMARCNPEIGAGNSADI